MSTNNYKYIYGPVFSWRLGRSLGVDLISQEKKICSFDCGYCQIGRTENFSEERKIFIPTEEVIKEIKTLPDSVEIDYITFSGKGEPTLAFNLGDTIEEIRKIRKEKIAVITNSSLLSREDVRKDLYKVDLVMAKLDACSEELFSKISNPVKSVAFSRVLSGIKEFKNNFKRKLALQIMFVEANKIYAEKIAEIAREVNPKEVELNTPLRPSGVPPLSREEMGDIKKYFSDMNVVSVYDREKKSVEPINKNDTLDRRGDF